MTAGEFREKLVEEFGEAFAFSYFDQGEFRGGDQPVLYPWSLVANDKFKREARRFLEREGVKLGPPICKHLQPKLKAAE